MITPDCFYKLYILQQNSSYTNEELHSVRLWITTSSFIKDLWLIMLQDKDFSFPLPRPLKKSTCLVPHSVLVKHQGEPWTIASLCSSSAHFPFLEPIPAMGPGSSFSYLLDTQTKVLVLFPRTSGQLHCWVGFSSSTLNTLYVFSRNPYISCCQEVALLFIARLAKLLVAFTRTQCLAFFKLSNRHAAKEASLK